MRGVHDYTEAMFAMAKRDDFVPASYPSRPIRVWHAQVYGLGVRSHVRE